LRATLPARRRRVWRALALLALLSADAASAAELEGLGALGIDLSFAPFFGRAPAGPILQRVRHPTSDQIRWARTESSVERTADLGAGRRLVRLDRFGRKADFELSAALHGADALVLDLRHNHGGVLRRMLRLAGRFTGPVPGAVRLVKADQVRLLAIPQPSGAAWRGRITVLVGASTISSGEVLAALLRRHAGAAVLGERTWGKDYVLRVEPVDSDWRALIPDGRIEVPGEVLAGGLMPNGPIPTELAARLPAD
jgi:Peptidase family S41